MEIGVRYRATGNGLVNVNGADHWMATRIQQKCVTTRSVAENHPVIASRTGDERGARTFDPGFNCEILQLQIGGGAHAYGIPRAVKHESLPNPTAAINCVSRKCAVIGADTVKRIALAGPPAYQAGRRCRTVRLKHKHSQKRI